MRTSLKLPVTKIKELAPQPLPLIPEQDLRVSSREDLQRKKVVSPPDRIQKKKTVEEDSGSEKRRKEKT